MHNSKTSINFVRHKSSMAFNKRIFKIKNFQ